MAAHTSSRSFLSDLHARVSFLSPVPAGAVLIPDRLIWRDMLFGGLKRIAGTVKEDSSPDIPVRRRVRLYRKLDGAQVRTVWSGEDGTYEFTNLADQLYFVVSFDHTGTYNAVIKDSITPEDMP